MLLIRLALHDPSLAAPLRLILAGLNLHDPPFTVPPYSASPDGSSSGLEQAYSTAAGEGRLVIPDSHHATFGAMQPAGCLVKRSCVWCVNTELDCLGCGRDH